ncbi:hypothetical protein OCK74_13030 [Chitinophagaceae bacterium LB-8]|jgi:hypothetical protein|uniref:Uncharacterized protein n=1 Tax=Paraflavisolibacter caeni TaxID=2982496 RepID=A0A9X3BIH5_9BACT|nr:hypothetical protein [Paraflavisolibacter caeni]MCU7550043.1 hypothetical protein [Paraflavisolibacter caeni]
MVKITDLKVGDVVRVIDEGIERDGIVEELSREDNMACVFNGVQEFWYTPEEIIPVPLTEKELLMLGFERENTEDGVKYMRGPFRVLVHDPGNYTKLDVWYREDRRHFEHPLYVHELQNHYLQMTKVPLEKPLTQ